jgi:hypothetical protein
VAPAGKTVSNVSGKSASSAQNTKAAAQSRSKPKLKIA